MGSGPASVGAELPVSPRSRRQPVVAQIATPWRQIRLAAVRTAPARRAAEAGIRSQELDRGLAEPAGPLDGGDHEDPPRSRTRSRLGVQLPKRSCRQSLSSGGL